MRSSDAGKTTLLNPGRNGDIQARCTGRIGVDIRRNLETLEYREQEKIRIDSLGAAKKVEDAGARLKLLVNADDHAGRFAWEVTSWRW